jgi:beta-lactamase superfamily II metal-dependent hydrolase
MPPIRILRAILPAVALALVLVAPAAAVTATGRLQIIQLDVGQGDGAVIISPLGEVAMVDNGVYTNPTPAGGVKVLAQLQALGVTHVKHHFASHYHSDHIGLMNTIFGSGGITLDYGWDRGGSYSSATYTNYVNVLGSRRRMLVKNQVITLDSLAAHPVTIKVVDLNGAGLSTTDENSLSVALKISYGEFDMLMAGDSPGLSGGGGVNVEGVIGPATGPVEAFKVHHHGSRYSSNAAFLSAIQPKVGVISVGTGNSYGHPTADALTRLHNAGVRTYWTETGSGVAPNPTWDKVSNGQVIISATWEGAGVDTIRGTGFADTFTNSGTAPDVTPPAVALTSPDGGETWKAGSSHPITWSATDAVGVTAVALAYSTDGGASFPHTIATGLANSGTYGWTVPLISTAAAKVRVIAQDAAGNAGRDSSTAVFTVDQWQIVATAGTGGDVSPAGTTLLAQGASQGYTITPWAGHAVTDVLVDGASVGPVTSYTFANVTADHTIAAGFADVAVPTVALTSPSGGESWETESVQSVTWTASDNVGVDSVTVEYSTTSAGGPWLVVARGLENTGTVDWTLPSTAADSVWVRVLAWDAAGNVGSDVSASALSIVSGATAVGDGRPAALALARPSPNPSRGATRLRFSLPQAGHARLEVVDVAGRVLWREEADRAAGEHSLGWDGRGPRGEAGAGLYFVRLTTPWGSRTQRLVRLD